VTRPSSVEARPICCVLFSAPGFAPSWISADGACCAPLRCFGGGAGRLCVGACAFLSRPGVWLLLTRADRQPHWWVSIRLSRSWLNTQAPPRAARGKCLPCNGASIWVRWRSPAVAVGWTSPMGFSCCVGAILIIVALMPCGCNPAESAGDGDTPGAIPLNVCGTPRPWPAACIGCSQPGDWAGFLGGWVRCTRTDGYGTGRLRLCLRLVIVAGCAAAVADACCLNRGRTGVWRWPSSPPRRGGAAVLLMAPLWPLWQWLLLAAAVFGGGAFAVYRRRLRILSITFGMTIFSPATQSLLMLHAWCCVGPAACGWADWASTSRLHYRCSLPLMFRPVCPMRCSNHAWARDGMSDSAAHFIPMVRPHRPVLK